MKPDWANWTRNDLSIGWQWAKEDLYYWLTKFCYTYDPLDRENPVKLFPKKPQVQKLAEAWPVYMRLLLPKSRQMMVSWICVALFLHDAIFYNSQRFFFQTEKQDKADDLLERAWHIYRFLPPYRPRGERTFCKIRFPDLNSKIEGVPQGADAIRQQTASGIFSDEMAFQDQAREAYLASIPTIGANGRYWGVSSARGGTFFKEMVFDEAA